MIYLQQRIKMGTILTSRNPLGHQVADELITHSCAHGNSRMNGPVYKSSAFWVDENSTD